MIPVALLLALALLEDRERLIEELNYIERRGCDGSPECNNVRPCPACVARYAAAGWQLHRETRK